MATKNIINYAFTGFVVLCYIIYLLLLPIVYIILLAKYARKLFKAQISEKTNRQRHVTA
jgi:hypothetical protein